MWHMIKKENLNGKPVVFINRQGVRIAPTYKEIRDMILELIRIYGKEEGYREIGIEEAKTRYKGIDIVWIENFKIFKVLDILEKKYPDFFPHIVSAGAFFKTLVLELDNRINPPVRCIKISSKLFWKVRATWEL